ncbi:MAG: cation diffusion facilitator family transporter [Anaerolineales bacterium]
MTNHQKEKNNRASLTRFAWLSIAASLVTLVLKSVAYLLTGSVGLLSDAIETIANLAAAVMALGMLTIAARPADDNHTFGHSKAEYFASVVEGALILAAAFGIISTAIGRLLNPQPLEQLGVGLVVSALASGINFFVAQTLLKVGKRENSITLEADAHHLMTDVWTSAGVIVGVGLVALTGWEALDSIIAIIMGLNITWTAIQLIRRSVSGLMDSAISASDLKTIENIMNEYYKQGVEFHALRTRQSASRRFVNVHVLVPGNWTVREAHRVADKFEHDVCRSLPETVINTHIEPKEDEISLQDINVV